MCVLEALESSSQKKLLSDVRCWEAVTLHDCDNSATAKCCIVVRSTRLWKNEVEQRKHRLSIWSEAAARDLANTHLPPTTQKSTPLRLRPSRLSAATRPEAPTLFLHSAHRCYRAVFHSFPLFVCGTCQLLATRAGLCPELLLTPLHSCHYFSHVNFET